MTDSERSRSPEPGLLPSDKLIALSDALRATNIPHAFGGAIALYYYRDPRSTTDIDVNIFLPPEQQAPVVEAVSQLYPLDASFEAAIIRDGQTRSSWGTTPVDFFFVNTEFHEAMGTRARSVPFLDTEISIISAEDLVVCKMLFDRPKDWQDIQAVVTTQAHNLDRSYVAQSMDLFVAPDNPRLERWRSIRP